MLFIYSFQGTSNQHMYSHSFETAEEGGGLRKRKLYSADISPRDNIHPDDLSAVRNRLIEVFVRAKPKIPAKFIPASGNFGRMNMIRGLFEEVIVVLNRYKLEDFHSNYWYLYGIGGLCKNSRFMDKEDQPRLEIEILNLMRKFQLNEEESKPLLKDLAQV